MRCKICEAEFVPVKSWQKYCSKGCREKNSRNNRKEYIKEYSFNYKFTPLKRYHCQKGTAKRRGVPFNITFEEWWAMWEPYWDKRGVGKDKYAMCRFNDTGAYEIGNVYIDTYGNNSRLAAVLQKQKQDPKTGRFINNDD